MSELATPSTQYLPLVLSTDDPLDDLRALANQVLTLNIEGVNACQIDMAMIRSRFEILIETADMSDPDTALAVGLFYEAIRLIDEVRRRLNRRKGELNYD